MPSRQEATGDLTIDTVPLIKNEIIMNATKTLKNGKSAGYDNIAVQLFKVDPVIASTILRHLFKAGWEGKKVPEDWCK